ncbi:ATP-dependent DNA helicase RecQ-like [Oscarella lobularis]|uniref:ATP-dependent DNA helicase RecQ-like n=1 Tax=Oscarella lobularis TaxID=121494 RepID=UPI003313A6DB
MLEPESITKRATDILRNVYHYAFRQGQLEAIILAVLGRDVVVRMTTGQGKSLFYQIPPLLCQPSLCLIVSPLSALMHDQMEKLRQMNLHVQCFVSVQQISQCSDADIKLSQYVYLSPECAVSSEWRSRLKNLELWDKVCLIAIDEAHCVVEWGDEFRVDFAKLSCLRELASCPVMVLTATATKLTMSRILSRTGIENPTFVKCPLNRKNMYYLATTKKTPTRHQLLQSSSLYSRRQK